LLESEGDLEGMADAWLLAGKLQYWASNDPAVAEQALERAGAYARQSGNHRAELESRAWLVATFLELPIPADVAIGRAEQLLEAAAATPGARQRYSGSSRRCTVTLAVSAMPARPTPAASPYLPGRGPNSTGACARYRPA
jgi:hypothetical protein